ncbi:hypothetical protein HK105_206656 [Polyrhizophydium stewartii]|uniref:WLM domain-containing protein n=1 Tax=Polyrhizophydium stewartii TaxID=2732419 RepID=A0ABR4N2P4_9FUNG|nr:hypothetical protein HK105_000133 [Polyrhizophydium stewartii]
MDVDGTHDDAAARGLASDAGADGAGDGGDTAAADPGDIDHGGAIDEGGDTNRGADGDGEAPMHVVVVHGGAARREGVWPETTLEALAARVLGRSAAAHRWLHAGRALQPTALVANCVPPGARLLLLAPPAAAIDAIAARDAAAAAAAARRPPPRAAAAADNAAPPSLVGRIAPLTEFADSAAAAALLARVRDDWGLRTVMARRGWRIGVLTELHPARDASILGYNRNKGQEIALRLRTNRLDGFRHFRAIVQVMVHELAHMVHSDHDASFHALNRELLAEVEAINRGRRLGPQAGPRFDPDPAAPDLAADAAPRVLGGGHLAQQVLGPGASLPQGRTPREVLAAAAALRLSREEVEIIEGCSTAAFRPQQPQQQQQ